MTYLTSEMACGRHWDYLAAANMPMVGRYSATELSEAEWDIVLDVVGSVVARSPRTGIAVSDVTYPSGWNELYTGYFDGLPDDEIGAVTLGSSELRRADVDVLRDVDPHTGARTKSFLVDVALHGQLRGSTQSIPLLLEAVVEEGAQPAACVKVLRPL